MSSDDWPSTRIGALIVDALLLAYYLVLHFVCRRFVRDAAQRRRRLRRDDEDDTGAEVEVIAWYRWKFIPWSVTVLSSSSSLPPKADDVIEVDDSVVDGGGGEADGGATNDGHTKVTTTTTMPYSAETTCFVCPCGCTCRRTISDLREDEPSRQRSGGVTCTGVILAVAVGCILGIFLHFIPCLWWTCDWGDGDNEGVRGGIWFAVWAAFTVWAIYWDAAEPVKRYRRVASDDSATATRSDTGDLFVARGSVVNGDGCC